MKKGAKTIAAPLVALVMLALAAPATAQQAEERDGADAAASADGEIIVTANRVEQNKQDVSGVIQAFGSEDLRKSGITEIRQLQDAVPGLSIANQEGNVEVFIRGVGSSNNTELGDPGAAPHLNGVYIPRPRGLGLMFYDIDRVEVNKGPQGTLYGRNALAGTLNIITARPNFRGINGYAQAEYANRDSYAAEGAINLPLGETFALRAAGYYSNRDYGYRNAGLQPALKPAGLEENYAGRLSLLWEPNDRLSVFISGDYGRETGTGYPGSNIFEAVTNTGLRPDKLNMKDVIYRAVQGDMNNELWGVQGNIRYSFDDFSVEYLGSYRSVDYEQTNAAAEGINYPGRDLSADDYDNFSNVFWATKSQSQVHELRLIADPGKSLRWTIGGFLFDENQQVGYLSLADKGYCCFSGTEFTMPDVNGTSYAAYVDTTYDVADRLRIFGGLRYSEEKKSRYGIGGNWALTLGGEGFACCMATRLGTEGFKPSLLDRPNFVVPDGNNKQAVAQFLIEGIGNAGARDTLISQIAAIANGTNLNGTCVARPDINNGFVTCPADPALNGGFSYANLTIPSQQVGSSKFNYFDWRAGVEYDIGDRSMVYAKVSTGHKAGGFNDSFQESTIPATYKPEKVLVIEGGSRNSFDVAGRRATLNLTGFYYDYTDQVFQDLTVINRDPVTGRPNGYSLASRNVGKSRIFGLEGEATFSFEGNFRLSLNALYLDTKVTEGAIADARSQNFSDAGKGAASTIDLTGNRLPLASKFSVSAKLSQNFPAFGGTFDWQALLSYRSSFYLTQFNERDVSFIELDADGNPVVVDTQSALRAGFPDRQQGFATLNLGAGWSTVDGRWRIEAYASNFLNEEVSQKALVGSGLNIRFLNDARRYGVRLISRF